MLTQLASAPMGRPRGIGASQVGAIMGRNVYTSPRQIWDELTGRAPAFSGNWNTRVGQALEPVIAEEYATLYGCRLEKGVTVQHPAIPWAFATPDFLRLGPDGKPASVLEIKNCRYSSAPGGEKDMRPAYTAQVRWQMACRDLPHGELFIHSMTKSEPNQFELLQIPRDMEQELILFSVCEYFWDYVVSDEPPPADFPKTLI